VWNTGKIAAQATAKIVIASANQLIDMRHCCLNSSRIAGSTCRRGRCRSADEVDDRKRPADRLVGAEDADADHHQVAERHVQHAEQAEGAARRRSAEQCRFESGISAMVSVTVSEVVSRKDHGRLLQRHGSMEVRVH
jgi:hypothetical protein